MPKRRYKRPYANDKAWLESSPDFLIRSFTGPVQHSSARVTLCSGIPFCLSSFWTDALSLDWRCVWSVACLNFCDVLDLGFHRATFPPQRALLILQILWSRPSAVCDHLWCVSTWISFSLGKLSYTLRSAPKFLLYVPVFNEVARKDRVFSVVSPHLCKPSVPPVGLPASRRGLESFWN